MKHGKHVKKRGVIIAAASAATALGVAALVPVLSPSANAADEQYGASMPYTRYEAEDASRSQGASEEHSNDLESTAIEASGQAYVALNNANDFLDFTATVPGNALDLRFSLPDHTSGRIEVRVNDSVAATLDLSSESAWQYVGRSKVYDELANVPAVDPDENMPVTAQARFRFDEVHTLLNTQVQKGDHIKIVKVGGDSIPYGIDFIELEQADPIIERPAGAVSVADYPGAAPNDGIDDSVALNWAMDQAANTGANIVYIPAGTWEFGGKIGINRSDLKIRGAGMWYTNVRFTSDQISGGGFELNDNANNRLHNVEFSDFYMSSNLKSRYSEGAQYKAFAGSAGFNARFTNLWIEHFECGFWMGRYVAANDMTYTEGMLVENSRIRNNLADGVNFAQGTKDSTVRNSSVRGNGDDSLASWASTGGVGGARVTEHNSFIGNTIELGWRAGGVGLFGGVGHVVRDNLIVNNFSGAGIRLSTVFVGHNFDYNTEWGRTIDVSHNKLVRAGTTDDFYGNTRGAIDFQEMRGDIRNVNVSDNLIVQPCSDDIRSDFGTGQAASDRGVNFWNNRRDDNATYTPQNLVVNYAQINGQVVRGVPENADYSLYWYQGEERAADGKTLRYWVSKADGVQINDDMEYSSKGEGVRVFNFVNGDDPQYLPESTNFQGEYDYVGEVTRSTDSKTVIRFWSHK